MKFFLLGILLSFSAMATITPEDMQRVEEISVNYMVALANPRLEPKLHSVSVVGELGDRLKVEFTYSERMFGDSTCSFWYSKKNQASVSQVICE